MASPDLQGYHSLTLFDVFPSDLVERALSIAEQTLAEWEPRDGSVEVVLIEALSVVVSEELWAINRVPDATVEVLMRLFGITREDGTPPTAPVRFHLASDTGQHIPAGSSFFLEVGGEYENIEFTNDTDIVIPTGVLTHDATLTATTNTSFANGTPAGTPLVMSSTLFNVERVELYSQVVGGIDPETAEGWRDRSIQRFQRLTTTLVLPEHFTSFALEQEDVYRAKTIDLYDPVADSEQQEVAITGGPTGGTFTLTFDGQVTAAIAYNATAADVVAALEALSNIAPGDVLGNGGPLPGTAVTITFTGSYAGRDVSLMAATSSLTGGTTPAVTVATTRAAGTAAPGTTGGNVAVAVLGPDGALLSAIRKTELDAAMTDASIANLRVHVVDPTITLIDVTAEVVVRAGYVAADVQAAIVAALDDYLSPNKWDWSGVVRRNELIAIIENVEGVDYLRAGHPTTPAADVTLTGVAALVDTGTLTITVSA